MTDLEKAVRKYLDIITYRQAFMIILWAPIPIAAVKLQAAVLTPTQIAIVLCIGGVFGLFQATANKYVPYIIARSLMVATNCLYVIGAIILYCYADSAVLMLMLLPFISGVTEIFDTLASSKFRNKHKHSYEIDWFEARRQTISSGAFIVSQGFAILFYKLFPDLDMFTVWAWFIIIVNGFYAILDFQKYYAMKAADEIYDRINVVVEDEDVCLINS